MRFSLLAGSVLAVWFILGSPAWPALSAPRRPVTFSARNLVRNGDFGQDKTAWATNLTGSHVGNDYGSAGPGMQIWPEFADNYGYLYQELYLPTQTTAATLAFNYRFVPGMGATFGYFRARITTPSRTIATLLDVTLYPGETWQTVRAPLGADELAALNAARSEGQHAYLIFELYTQFLYVNVDDVVLEVSGRMDYPSLEGSIAYVGLDAAGYAQTVEGVDPNSGKQRTLWTHPGPSSATNAILDVAWRPDGSELAFSSNHEMAYSAFHSDVYAIRPDGSGLRRITNPPSRAELAAGDYPSGAVTGRIYNNYGRVNSFFVYVEGAGKIVAVDVGEYGDETGFTVPNVAVFSTGLPYVVFIWSSLNCANGKEYTSAVAAVIPGRTVDVGLLNFNGACGEYNCDSISWQGDGSQVGVSVITPRRFQAGGQAIGAELFDAPLTARELAWSPVDDRILYRNQTFDNTTSGIYLTRVGGGPGTRLVADEGALWVTPAWLPDGSGFIYTLDRAIYQYDFATAQSTPLAELHNEYAANPSLSPDGRYVVFERCSTGAPTRYDLWIVNRANPAEMWPLTDDGRSSNPDWSRVAPQERPAATPSATLRAGPGADLDDRPAPAATPGPGVETLPPPTITALPTAEATSSPAATLRPTEEIPAGKRGGGLCPLGVILPLLTGVVAAFRPRRPALPGRAEPPGFHKGRMVGGIANAQARRPVGFYRKAGRQADRRWPERLEITVKIPKTRRRR